MFKIHKFDYDPDLVYDYYLATADEVYRALCEDILEMYEDTEEDDYDFERPDGIDERMFKAIESGDYKQVLDVLNDLYDDRDGQYVEVEEVDTVLGKIKITQKDINRRMEKLKKELS